MKHTITLSKLDLSISYSLKDNSPRGVKTVPGNTLKIGDKIVIDNYFHEIIEEAAEETEKRTHEEIIEDIIEFFNDNENLYNSCIEELDGYNSYLADDRYYYMEDLNEFYQGADPLELLYRVFYGHDETYTTDSTGNKTYGEFNPNREYFKYNGYGNLISTDYKDYSDFLNEDLIEELSENRADIYTIEENEELTALFNELEQSEQEAE